MSAILFGLIKFTDIPGTKRAIMWVLADHANDQGVSWPNRETLSAEVGVGEKPLRDNLRALEQEGWLTMKLGNGRGNPTRYALNIPKLRTAATGFDEAFPHEEKGGPEREGLGTTLSDKGGHLEPLKGGTSFPKGWYPTFNEPSRTIKEPSNRRTLKITDDFKESMRVAYAPLFVDFERKWRSITNSKYLSGRADQQQYVKDKMDEHVENGWGTRAKVAVVNTPVVFFDAEAEDWGQVTH